MSYNTFTLTGTYKKPNGVADKGGVLVIPSVIPLVDNVGNVILAGAVQADLDSSGSFSLVLPTTGANLLPATFGYTLIATTNGAGRFTDVTFTPGASGTTLNVAQIVPAPLPALVTPTAVTTAGLDGAVAALVADAASGSRGAIVATSYLIAAGTGIDPTGAVDSTAAIQAKIDALTSGGTLFIPRGTYKLTSNLTITNDNTVLRGAADGTFLDFAGAGIVIDGTAAFTTEIGLRDLSIRRTGTAGPALHLKGGGAGAGAVHVNASNVRVRSSTGEGLLIQGSYIGTFVGCYWMGAATYGIKVAADTGAGTIFGNNMTFVGGETQGCVNAMYLDTAVGLTFVGHAIEGNTSTGVEIPRGAYGVAFYNCYWESNAGYDLKVGTTANCHAVGVYGGFVTDGSAAKNNSIILIRGKSLEFRGVPFVGHSAEPISVQEASAGAVWGRVDNCTTDGLRTGVVNYGTATEFGHNFIGRSESVGIAQHYKVTATLDFPSISANSEADLTVTVTGAVVGDDATAHPNSLLEAGLSIAHVTVNAANTVTVRLRNNTGSPIDPVARNWRVRVWR